MVSPIPMLPSPLVSAILAALVNVMDEVGGAVDSIVTVTSFGAIVLGSSLVSEIVPPFVPCAVTVAVLDTPPAFIA